LPSAHIPTPHPDGWRALTIEAERGRCQRRVVPRSCRSRSTPWGIPPCSLECAPTPSRPPPPCPVSWRSRNALWRAGCAQYAPYPNFG